MPRVVDHAQKREEILERSLAVFARDGYEAVTMRTLAAEAGVSTGTLYHYFDNKSALFAAMFAWLFKRDLQVVTDGVSAALPPADRAELLLVYVGARAAPLEAALRVALDYHRSAPDDAGKAVLAQTLGEYRAAIHRELGVGDAAVAATILSALLGVLVQRILDPVGASLDAQLAVLRPLIRGVVRA